jgi:hypothetical protein
MLNVHLTNTTTDLLRKVLAAVAISATALAFIGAGSAGTRRHQERHAKLHHIGREWTIVDDGQALQFGVISPRDLV